ncbi:hypothetical protein OIU77_030717 [Salix suchowensis]|uniref:Uncharacterized protein n=1 Tax=Salix suchowensis TaxID=1278906 RepID=A0ABQ9BCX9_9ROSI|nr:hypothetical protein OIU77_030717 [Salix suchowensis]
MDLKAPGPEGFEVKEVIWRCDGSKELSPEGFTFAFYRKAWIILGNELLQFVNGFLRTESGRLRLFLGNLNAHLQYADDTLVSVPNDFMSLIHVKRILMWFELASGLRLNFYKSSSVLLLEIKI